MIVLICAGGQFPPFSFLFLLLGESIGSVTDRPILSPPAKANNGPQGGLRANGLRDQVISKVSTHSTFAHEWLCLTKPH